MTRSESVEAKVASGEPGQEGYMARHVALYFVAVVVANLIAMMGPWHSVFSAFVMIGATLTSASACAILCLEVEHERQALAVPVLQGGLD